MPLKFKPDRPWTADERQHVADLMAKGYGPADIAACVPGRSRVEVNGLVYRLKNPKGTNAAAREMTAGFPVHRADKEWPIGCFEGQDVDQDTLAREATRQRLRPPMRANRFGVPVYG